MSNIVITVSEDGHFYDVSNNDKVYIFKNIKEYEEEICEMIKNNKMSFTEMKTQIESWGGEIDLILLKDLIKNYQKKCC
jgi:uncharacterized pyridoxamine 5'-phosphate oxidase family protein